MGRDVSTGFGIVAVAMRLPRSFPDRARGASGGGLCVLALLSQLALPASVEGYRFYPESDELSPVPSAAEARGWDPLVWAARDTLVWQVADDPDWSASFDSASDVVPFVEEALAVWSGIPGADIRWRVAGVSDEADRALDGQNLVLVEDDNDPFGTGPASYARIWFRRSGGAWLHVECDAVLTSSTAEALGGGEVWGLKVLIHEFGHCLGLQHGATAPIPRWEWDWSASSVWFQDPAMSYGRDRDRALPSDDALGARLLRPASGWLETTGSLAGTVSLDGEPAPFVSVWALAAGAGGLRATGSVFTNEDGEFLFEGLPPGGYILWIHPLMAHDAHPRLMASEPPLAFSDVVVSQAFAVRAGGDTLVGELRLAGGRGP